MAGPLHLNCCVERIIRKTLNDLHEGEVMNSETQDNVNGPQQSNSASKDSYRQGQSPDRTKSDADSDPKMQTASRDKAKTEKDSESTHIHVKESKKEHTA